MQTFWMDAARLSHWNFYLSWIGIALVIVGAFVSAGSVLITKQIDKLTKIESEASQRKIASLELATRPKPFRDRLIAQLNAINPKILIALEAGTTNFTAELVPHHFADLQRLASEPGAGAYISFRGNGVLSIRSDIGQTNGAVFTLNPSLLNP
jgi:hypothetical protein